MAPKVVIQAAAVIALVASIGTGVVAVEKSLRQQESCSCGRTANSADENQRSESCKE